MAATADPDPIYTPGVYLLCCDVVCHMAENMAIDFQLHADGWDRATAEKHFTDRNALIHVQGLLARQAEEGLGRHRPAEGKN